MTRWATGFACLVFVSCTGCGDSAEEPATATHAAKVASKVAEADWTDCGAFEAPVVQEARSSFNIARISKLRYHGPLTCDGLKRAFVTDSVPQPEGWNCGFITTSPTGPDEPPDQGTGTARCVKGNAEVTYAWQQMGSAISD
jgi:hypothetical protein